MSIAVMKIALLLISTLCFAAAKVNGKLVEETMSVPEMIRYWGYPAESHEVLTKDGYYLTLHRIPYGRTNTAKDRPVFFLQHGLLCSSSNWVTNLPYQSLAYLLADAGYDVWLGNVRGNTYSRKHRTFSVESKMFWDFSFDEMGKYDLPAMVDYALNITGQKQLYYVGHSQGTMMAFAGLSQYEDLNKKIKIFFALAPVARLDHATSPITYLSYLENEIGSFFNLIGVHEFLPSIAWVKMLADRFCGSESKLCDNMLFLIAGSDDSNMNVTRTPVYLSHTPAGTSVRNMLHFAQLVKEGKFKRYNHGWSWQMWLHGISPSVYDLSAVKTKVVLFSGSRDKLADPKDVKWLTHQLPRIVKHTIIKEYNNLDFIWGLSANRKVYKKIIRMAEKLN